MKIFVIFTTALFLIFQNVLAKEVRKHNETSNTVDHRASGQSIADEGDPCPTGETFVFNENSDLSETGETSEDCTQKLRNKRIVESLNTLIACRENGGNKLHEGLEPDEITFGNGEWQCSNTAAYVCCISPSPSAAQW